jgi:competence protein ComEA
MIVSGFAFSASLYAAGETLPEGTGKQVAMRYCSGCHNPDAFSTYAKTKEDWTAVVLRMGPRTAASGDELNALAEYFGQHFPKTEDPNKINVNKADAKRISEGLGLTMEEAEAIVSYRDRRGTFRTWGDLLVIYGVDGRKLQAAQDKMSF